MDGFDDALAMCPILMPRHPVLIFKVEDQLQMNFTRHDDDARNV